MEKKFIILLHDDWELMGSGLGNVADLQYLPSLFLMNLAKDLGIRMTFMVEVAQQLAFIKYQDLDPNIQIQRKLWEDTVKLMKLKGFDVQLHIHPQWYNAEYYDGFFYVNDNWNIATYDKKARTELLNDSIEYLYTLLKPLDKDYEIHSFKAGSWGLQPSEHLFQDFTDFGIKIVMGVRKNMRKEKLNINYEGLEEDTLPYFPDYNDITKLSENNKQLVIIPLAYYSPTLSALAYLALDRIKKNIFSNSKVKDVYGVAIPDLIRRLNPVKKEKIRYSLRPYTTHLKIGNQPFNYLKRSFDEVIQRYRSVNQETIPITIESHSKDYINNYNSVKKFLYYITKKYGHEVEFLDLSTFKKGLNSGEYFIKSAII